MRYCVDFDDLCDETRGEVAKLVNLRVRYPRLKVTLFTIPQRTSQSLIDSLKVHSEWLQLAPHGWRHTHGECLSWTDEEAEEKIRAAMERGIDAPIFRAPGWLLDNDVYTACEKLDIALASHAQIRVAGTRVREYIYNDPNMAVTAIHGHLTNTPATDNYIDDLEMEFPEDAEFVFPQEIACVYSFSLHKPTESLITEPSSPDWDSVQRELSQTLLGK